ncbi:MAG: hypothetical protein RML36_06545 [Anaerolineae bacterium]|nr:hypothetical protein [Anaerolineae bacterium]MDW8099127.1 hypothetical protein [Anaerolineae bacterium]
MAVRNHMKVAERMVAAEFGEHALKLSKPNPLTGFDRTLASP